jgi:hypothetical protein
MKRKLCRWLLMVFLLPLATGFYCHRPLAYAPNIVLKEDGQPCISIPLSELSFFNKEKQFDIIAAEVFQVGVGTLWEKDYFNVSKRYHVQAGECLRFEYHFQENIVYTIGFITATSGSKEFEHGDQKSWSRSFRIKKVPDGTVKLLFDTDAREDE